MVEYYRSVNWTFPEKKVWQEEREKKIKEWKIREMECIKVLRKAEEEAEEKRDALETTRRGKKKG